jgi:hypothetical protein
MVHSLMTVDGDVEFIDWSELFDLLSSGYRRAVIAALRENGRAGELELAAVVAGRLAGVPPDRVGPRERNRVRTGLVHVHLPKLAAANVVSWDRVSQTVGLTDRARRLPLDVPLAEQ